jgi:hypothetical protein
MKRAWRIGVLAGCVAGGLAVASRPVTGRADLFYFAGGGAVQLHGRARGERILLETPDRTLEFHRDDFRAIVPGHWPEDEWASRRESALAGGAESRFAAAWWALENGMTPQAVAMVREAHAADPRHAPSARMVAALDRLDRPISDPDLGPLRRAMGGHADECRGPHVVLLHQHGRAEADERVDMLERVVTSYYLLLSAHGIQLPAPGHRLATAWFARRSDYLAFLDSEKATAFRATQGYYHPTLDAVFVYDARSSDRQMAARKALAARRRELSRMTGGLDLVTPGDRLHRQSGEVPPRDRDPADDRRPRERRARDLDRQELLLDMERRSLDFGTAAHEMVHQLVAVSGLAPRHDAFPIWLHEGFAAQFEVLRGGRWAGIGRAHDLRLPDWRTLQPPPRLAPLVRDIGFGHGYRRDSYAAAWALVYFMRKAHPQEFLNFIDLLRAPHSIAAPGDDRVFSAFRSAFSSNTNALEADWHRFVATLRTPLEAQTPIIPPMSALPRPGRD